MLSGYVSPLARGPRLFMTIRYASLLLVAALVVSAWSPAPALSAARPQPASARAMLARPMAAPAAIQAVSPAQLLNPDGTLRLDGQFAGSLDLKGWNVQLDARRGPVFAPGGGGEAAPGGQWASLGAGASALNGTVYALAVSGSTVYAAGDFIDADSRGASADYLVRWDANARHWSAVDPNAHFINGDIDALAVAGGTLYVGGGFFGIQGPGGAIPGTANLAQWNGTSWTGLGGDGAGGSALNGGVFALAVTGTVVYAGGDFTSASNSGSPVLAAAHVARWDAVHDHWSALGHGATPTTSALNGRVLALAVLGNAVYVGGQFTDAAGLAAADYVAQWNAASLLWSSLGHGAAGNGSLNHEVKALAVDGSGNVFAGGVFTNVVDAIWGTLVSADYIARWDGSWHSLGGGAGPDYGALHSPVYAIAVSGTTVYAGGSFTNAVGLAAADYVAAANWNGAQYTWAALGNNGEGQAALLRSVLALATDGAGRLYAGGDFEYVADSGTLLDNASYLAAWDGAHWAALAGQPSGALDTYYHDNRVVAVAVSGANVYVGGDFVDVHDANNVLTAADYVARWDGSRWWALGNNGDKDGALDDSVESIVTTGTTVYVGGVFDQVNNGGHLLPNAAWLASWDLNTGQWSALGHGATADAPALNGPADALLVNGNTLYAGGEFSTINNSGTPLSGAAHLGAWNSGTGQWSAVSAGAAAPNALNDNVNDIVLTGTTLYVGGSFTHVNDNGLVLTAADYVAAWDMHSQHWSALGHGATAGDPALNNTVRALAVAGATLYAGGAFTDVHSSGAVLGAADYVARWDTNTGSWSALGSNGAGGGALNGPVNGLALAGSNLYVGGSFSGVNNSGTPLPAADKVARWDGARWSALGGNGAGQGALSNYDLGPNYVFALAVGGQNLYVGGYFYDVSNSGTPLPAADEIAVYGLARLVYLPLVRR